MIQGDPGPATEKTDRNIRAARSHVAHWGRWLVEYKFFTGRCVFRPRIFSGCEVFFNEGVVKWVRVYWLTCGVFCSRSIPERRGPGRVSNEEYFYRDDERGQ